MTPADLLAAYPNIKNAVGYVELVFRDFDGLFPGQLTPWQMLRKERPDAEPAWVAEIIRKSVESSDPVEPSDEPFLSNARREMDHPMFMTYLAGIMGAL